MQRSCRCAVLSCLLLLSGSGYLLNVSVKHGQATSISIEDAMLFGEGRSCEANACALWQKFLKPEIQLAMWSQEECQRW
jgi:hypothetical protein